MADDTHNPTLIDGDITLRRPRPSDVEDRIAAGNAAEIQYMYGIPKETVGPVTQAHAQDWVSFHSKRKHSWFVDISGRLSGVIFLHGFAPADRRATLAMGLLREKDLGRGYGSRALNLLLGEAFGALNLHRLSLRVLAYNARAIAAYHKAGFQVEGRERQSARVGDLWHDDILMGLLAPEWRALQ